MQAKGWATSFSGMPCGPRSLIHLLDGCSASPLDDMIRVNNELALFDATLAKRPQVVAINKVDLPEVKARVAELKAVFQRGRYHSDFYFGLRENRFNGTGEGDLEAASRRPTSERKSLVPASDEGLSA